MKNPLVTPFLTLTAGIIGLFATATTPLLLADSVNLTGRVAISHDGNHHDEDDIPGMPMAAALMWAAGESERLVHVQHSTHLGFSTFDQESEMIESAEGMIEYFEVDESAVFNAYRELEAAVAHFAEQAMQSTADDPLWFVCAGPMEVPWRSLQAVKDRDPSKLQYIRCVSHHSWNEDHDKEPEDDEPPYLLHRWSDMQADFPEVTFIRIDNQNLKAFNKSFKTWEWLPATGIPGYEWLWTRNFKDTFDVSDAGMVYYILTGQEYALIDQVRSLLEGNMSANPAPVCEILSPQDGLVLNEPGNLTLEATATDDSNVVRVDLLHNGTVIGTRSQVPYVFNVQGLLAGVHELSVTALDDEGASGSDQITILVKGTGPNEPPVATITSPVSGSVLTAPASIQVTVDATDSSDGLVTRVELRRNGELVGTDEMAPYRFDLANLGEGSHVLVARAIDDEGVSSDSTPVSIDVVALHSGDHPLFLETNGIIVMEAESTASPLGKWKSVNEPANFTGTGAIEFTGNRTAGGDPDSPLVYRFQVQNDGIYQLELRAHKRLDGAPSDHCNDAYIRMEGDYDAVGGAAPLDWLMNDTKIFGGAHNGWGWAASLDRDHNKRFARYAFKAGEIYTLVLSGRSQRFNVDRIVIYERSLYPQNEWKSTAISESPQATGQNRSPIANAGSDQTVTDSDNNGVETVQLNGAGSSDPDGTVATYEWYTPGSDSPVATGVSPSVQAQVGDNLYELVVTDNAGVRSARDGVLITVLPGGTPPAITSGPASITVAEGGSASFSIEATGTPAPSIQWQTDRAGTWANIADATSENFTIAAVSTSDAGSYRAVASNANGSVTSTSAMLTVEQVIPDSQPGIGDILIEGGIVGEPMLITPSVMGGDAPLSWSLENAPEWLAIDPANGSVTGTPVLTGLYTFDLQVTDADADIDLITIEIEVLPSTSGGTDQPDGLVMRDYWLNVTGTDLQNLLNDPRYPEAPDGRDLLGGGLESFGWGPLGNTANYGDRYGELLQGYIVPEETAEYTLWMAADDEAEFWMSADQDPANLEKTLWIKGWTKQHHFTTLNVDNGSQQSAIVQLEAGRSYYFVLLHKEGSGGDHVSVAWTKEGAIPTSSDIIPASALSSQPVTSAGVMVTIDFEDAIKHTSSEVTDNDSNGVAWLFENATGSPMSIYDTEGSHWVGGTFSGRAAFSFAPANGETFALHSLDLLARSFTEYTITGVFADGSTEVATVNFDGGWLDRFEYLEFSGWNDLLRVEIDGGIDGSGRLLIDNVVITSK